MIMITGGLGFLGVNLAKLLCDRGESVLLTSNRKSEVPPLLVPFVNKSLKVTPLDITSLENVSQTIREFGVKSIVHAAIRSEKGNTPLFQAMEVNITGTINVLEAAHRAAIKRVIFISSEAVYQGMPDTTPFKEEEKLFITSDRFIPGTKKAGEIICLMYGKEHGLEVISVRLSRLYGPLYQGIRNLPGLMLANAVNGIPTALEQYDPAEAHDFIYVKDAARGLVLLLKAPMLHHRIYNVGFGSLVSISQFADAIGRILPEAAIQLGDKSGPLTSTKTPMDINASLDISRIREETGFVPEYDAYRGVEHYINWARHGIY
ncbi:MAG: NAD-dependent epimerase/dehydratase family protein [Candidatus Binatia bacterium]